jgi:hypothetical protein
MLKLENSKIWGIHSSAFEDSGVLERDALSLGSSYSHLFGLLSQKIQ